MAKPYRLGIDIGSTTAKLALMDQDGQLKHKRYVRHNTEILETLKKLLEEAAELLPETAFTLSITGSAGMGLCERFGFLFTQEVVAAAEVVRQLYPDVRTLIDLGGEDSKIIFFNEQMRPDIRMNGNCAGGTGAFIDQMASLLDVPVEEINGLAEKASTTYPIASRCGVFGKTDVQNLISRDIPREDIAASLYRAVSFQVINTLSRGTTVKKQLLFAGGPLSFQPALREAFRTALNLEEEDIFLPPEPALLPAMGAALHSEEEESLWTFTSLRGQLDLPGSKPGISDRLPALFQDKAEFDLWLEQKEGSRDSLTSLDEAVAMGPLYLGIDSGSTTTKIVLLDQEGRLAAHYYGKNRGNPIAAVQRGLKGIMAQADELGVILKIARSSVTGYGEDLIQFAFSLDEGHVETIAHFRGARFFDPEVSFILDIGGQDMKAIFIQDGIISHLELNEACSSGCGSFIETFAHSLGENVQDFAHEACLSQAPCDLGTRCTVFMNSKVKQSLREGATRGDISAGLAYSVIKNCLNKVLKLTDYSKLGKHVVVQGGTFRNPAVYRSLEQLLGFPVSRSPHPELMGAWGAALIARDTWEKEQEESRFIGLEHIDQASLYEKKAFTCQGCENLCQVSRLRFERDGKTQDFYSGNKCEKIFSNRLKGERNGENLHQFKRDLLFDRPLIPQGKPRMRLGIPRVLNMWDDFPFWSTLFRESGMEVVLSDPSTMAMAETGYGTVMSENICFPAKIANGHIMNLIDKQVDRIFYPMVRYSRPEYDDSLNDYNCPVVTGYPQVIESSINPAARGIPLDNPPVSFASPGLLRRFCWHYLKGFDVAKDQFRKAFSRALEEQNRFKLELRQKAQVIMDKAREEKRQLIMLIGRPYHVDALVNHKISEMISALGVDLITEDSLPREELATLQEVEVLTQWAFPNRIYDAAIWAGEQPLVEVVQLNSFGCGPDAIAVDEVKPLLNQYGKNPTVIRIDEITSPGSVKLRIRSMIESLKMRGKDFELSPVIRQTTPSFGLEDKKRKILAPMFSPFYTDFLVATFRNQGYDLDILPMPDKESIELGLKYANNDICYPATIVIGDLIKALQSGNYPLENVAVGLTQTGGQCRASSYVSMLKKAMVNAGFQDIPVVTISTHSGPAGMNDQPGFKVPASFRLDALFGMIYGDTLARLYYSHAPRERVKGQVEEIVQRYISTGKDQVNFRNPAPLYRLLEEALAELNALDLEPVPLPRVGIVGEIYVKFNPFSNGYVCDRLMAQGIEPEVPPLVNFFLTMFITDDFNKENFIEKKSPLQIQLMKMAEHFVYHHIGKANRILERAKVPTPSIHRVRHLADNAQTILSLINQYGESWLLAGDIVTFLEEGIEDVVCLQPFGCIANHIIAKGMEKKMKDSHPSLNVLFLDRDSGTSEVNAANRLDFLIKGAKESFKGRMNG